MAENPMRPVTLLEKPHLLLVEADAERANRFLEMVGLGRADDRRRDARLGQQPRERDLGRLHAAAPRNLRRAIGDGEIGVVVVHLVRELVGLRANRLAAIRPAAIAGEKPARQRTPRNDADPWSWQNGSISRSSSR